jgi:hypothetical protein
LSKTDGRRLGTIKALFHTLAVILGIAGSLLAVLAIAVYEGYISAADVGSFTDGELGTLSALAYVAAIGFAVAEREKA